VKDLNSALRECAGSLGILYADPAGDMPHTQEMAFDYGHLTPEGDRRLAGIFSAAILEQLER